MGEVSEQEGLWVVLPPTCSSSRLYSPSPEEGLGDEFDLIDHSDLHILDFSKYAFLKCSSCQVLWPWVVTGVGVGAFALL